MERFVEDAVVIICGRVSLSYQVGCTPLLVLVHALTNFLLLTWPAGSTRRAAFDEAKIGRRIGM
jgi:hypothetical protein